MQARNSLWRSCCPTATSLICKACMNRWCHSRRDGCDYAASSRPLCHMPWRSHCCCCELAIGLSMIDAWLGRCVRDARGWWGWWALTLPPRPRSTSMCELNKMNSVLSGGLTRRRNPRRATVRAFDFTCCLHKIRSRTESETSKTSGAEVDCFSFPRSSPCKGRRLHRSRLVVLYLMIHMTPTR